MRRLYAALCLLLGGCYATTQEVRQQLGEQFIGKNVDTLVLSGGRQRPPSK
jgi:hypothetical protein